MQNVQSSKKNPRFRLYLWLLFWTLEVAHLVFIQFRFYDKSLNSLIDKIGIVAVFMLGIQIFFPIWQDRNLWRLLGIGISLLSVFVFLFYDFAPDYEHEYYALLDSKPLQEHGYQAKLERRFDTVATDCRTKVVLCYERNYWNILKETKDIYSVRPGITGSFEIVADGKLLTLTANAEDSNRTKMVKTFSTDWNQVKPETHN